MPLGLMKVLQYFVLDSASSDNYKQYEIKSEFVADHNGEQDVKGLIFTDGKYLIVTEDERHIQVTKEQIKNLNIYKYVRVN